MRIVNFSASIAVLLLTAIFFLSFAEPMGSSLSSQSESFGSTDSKDFNLNQHAAAEENLKASTNKTASVNVYHKWMNSTKAEDFLNKEGGIDRLPVECCPSVVEMTTPDYGINTEGGLVQLYKAEKRQQFYEISCKNDVEDQPCRFMGKKFHKQSRCVQVYSFSYAIVMQPEEKTSDSGKVANKQFTSQFASILPNQTDKYVLDYIRIRSGCTCEVQAKVRKKMT